MVPMIEHRLIMEQILFYSINNLKNINDIHKFMRIIKNGTTSLNFEW